MRIAALLFVGILPSAAQGPPSVIAVESPRLYVLASLSKSAQPNSAGSSSVPHAAVQVGGSDSRFYVLKQALLRTTLYLFDNHGSYLTSAELNGHHFLGVFDVSPSDEIAIEEEDGFNRIASLLVLDQRGFVLNQHLLPSSHSRVVWSGQSIVAIGRSIDVIDGSSFKGTQISRSLPAKIDGDLSLISRLDADNLWFVNRYNATFAVVSEKGALQSDPAGLLDSPELSAARAMKAGTPDRATQRTLLVAAAAADRQGSLAVIPTGYQVSQGIPMNLFDKQGHLRSRFLLAQPVLTGNKVFAPQNMAFSDNNHLLIASNSGEVAIYKIP